MRHRMRRTHCLRVAAIFWLVALAGVTAAGTAARAEIRIDVSRYDNGALVVAGTTAPNSPVVLDGRARTTSDGGGHFRFEEHYRPDTCMSDIRSGADIYSAVIAGCFGEFAIEREQPGRTRH